MAILIMIFGAVAIVAGFVGKRFYGADIWGGDGDFDGPSLPRWLGGGLFALVGVFLVAAGIVMLVRSE